MQVQYRSLLRFAELLELKNETKEQYAEREAKAWLVRVQGLAEREANELVIDISTGKVLGKRKDVEDRFS